MYISTLIGPCSALSAPWVCGGWSASNPAHVLMLCLNLSDLSYICSLSFAFSDANSDAFSSSYWSLTWSHAALSRSLSVSSLLAANCCCSSFSITFCSAESACSFSHSSFSASRACFYSISYCFNSSAVCWSRAFSSARILPEASNWVISSCEWSASCCNLFSLSSDVLSLLLVSETRSWSCSRRFYNCSIFVDFSMLSRFALSAFIVAALSRSLSSLVSLSLFWISTSKTLFTSDSWSNSCWSASNCCLDCALLNFCSSSWA